MSHISDPKLAFEDKQMIALTLLAEITMSVAQPVKSPCWGKVGDMSQIVRLLTDIKQSIEDEE